jgi:hypothetical protein
METIMQFRLFEHEKALLLSKCKILGQSPSFFLRNALREAMEKLDEGILKKHVEGIMPAELMEESKESHE